MLFQHGVQIVNAAQVVFQRGAAHLAHQHRRISGLVAIHCVLRAAISRLQLPWILFRARASANLRRLGPRRGLGSCLWFRFCRTLLLGGSHTGSPFHTKKLYEPTSSNSVVVGGSSHRSRMLAVNALKASDWFKGLSPLSVSTEAI